MLKLSPVALFALVSAPVAAQTPAPAPQVAEVNKSDLDRMVCEKQEQLGSRLGARKVCKTVKEWQEQRRIQREEVQDQQLRGLQQAPSS